MVTSSAYRVSVRAFVDVMYVLVLSTNDLIFKPVHFTAVESITHFPNLGHDTVV